MRSREWRRKIFKKHPFRACRGHSVHNNKISPTNPTAVLYKLWYSLATAEKPCVSTSQTKLVFGEIPVIQNHDSKSLPFLLTMVFNCFLFFLKRKWSFNESAGRCHSRKWYQSDSFHLTVSTHSATIYYKSPSKRYRFFAESTRLAVSESLSILFHFIHSTKF